jgi:hypothetical protein
LPHRVQEGSEEVVWLFRAGLDLDRPPTPVRPDVGVDLGKALQEQKAEQRIRRFDADRLWQFSPSVRRPAGSGPLALFYHGGSRRFNGR